jgi:hypothetical protein
MSSLLPQILGAVLYDLGAATSSAQNATAIRPNAGKIGFHSGDGKLTEIVSRGIADAVGDSIKPCTKNLFRQPQKDLSWPPT